MLFQRSLDSSISDDEQVTCCFCQKVCNISSLSLKGRNFTRVYLRFLLLLLSPLNSSSLGLSGAFSLKDQVFLQYREYFLPLFAYCSAHVTSYVNMVDPLDVSSRALFSFHMTYTLGTSSLCLEIFL